MSAGEHAFGDTMNKIMREHYPAVKLPEDLREGIDPSKNVTVTVIEDDPPEKIMTLEEMFSLRTSLYLSKEEIDDHIRTL